MKSYLCTEPAPIKRARLKKLKLEKALEDKLSSVIQMSEDVEKEAKRSQIIAEFEVLRRDFLDNFVTTVEVELFIFRLQILSIRKSKGSNLNLKITVNYAA